MLSVMHSYMQTCHFILLNNNCLFINGTKLVKISGLFRFTCIVCGIQCSELNYILIGEHLRCLYFCSQKRKMAESISMAQPSLLTLLYWTCIVEYGKQDINHRLKIVLHSDDGTGIKMIFKDLMGRNFQGQEYVEYIRHIVIVSMFFSPGIIEHCRDGEVIYKGTIPNIWKQTPMKL